MRKAIAAVATKKTHDHSPDALMQAFFELQRVEDRYTKLDALSVSFQAGSVERTYCKPNLRSWRGGGMRSSYMPPLCRHNQLTLAWRKFGFSSSSLDLHATLGAAAGKELWIACERLIHSIDGFLSKTSDLPLYPHNHTNPFKAFEERLKEIGHPMAETEPNQAPELSQWLVGRGCLRARWFRPAEKARLLRTGLAISSFRADAFTNEPPHLF